MTQLSDMRSSLRCFKEVPGGYVFRAPSLYALRGEHYLVSVAQRDEIAEILIPPAPGS